MPALSRLCLLVGPAVFLMGCALVRVGDSSPLPRKLWPRSLAFSPDGSVLAVGLSGTRDNHTTGGVRLLEAATLRPLAEGWVPFEVRSLTYSPDGTQLFLSGQSIYWRGNLPPGGGKSVCWFDPVRCKWNGEPALSHEELQSLVCAADNQACACKTGNGNSVAVRPLFSGPRSEPIHCHEELGRGRAVASERGPLAYSDAANRIHVLDVPTHEELVCLTGHEQPVVALLFTADGKRLISAGGDESDFERPVEVIVWDLPSGRLQRRLPKQPGPFNHFFLTPDGCRLAVGVRAVNESTNLTVWDVESGDKIHTSEYLAYGTPAAFSPDGLRLAVLEYGGAIKILDLPARRAPLAAPPP